MRPLKDQGHPQADHRGKGPVRAGHPAGQSRRAGGMGPGPSQRDRGPPGKDHRSRSDEREKWNRVWASLAEVRELIKEEGSVLRAEHSKLREKLDEEVIQMVSWVRAETTVRMTSVINTGNDLTAESNRKWSWLVQDLALIKRWWRIRS
ncbi:uncharacterized protein N7458_009069 [Penicillium daleae]|uniref:Uncharacterized protein n=1 Tax=Penicillium daleae TaxID=63821 RepID=A0AAD6FYQ9_9EURO|nr:uncharacterized protein N7458_009069 [Penicillium daleae]KAJ5438071.1 hypothetical protein N7458_009069 [Penicillium daleae]